MLQDDKVSVLLWKKTPPPAFPDPEFVLPVIEEDVIVTVA
jgi:hypothetical protein